MLRKPIDLLLQWAFDELSKRRTSSHSAIWSMVEQYGAYGGVRFGGRYPNRYPSIGFPHPDAIALEKAILSLEKTTIDWDDMKDEILGEFAGILLDHPILYRPYNVSVLVASHAIMGTRPEWNIGTPKPSGIKERNGWKMEVNNPQWKTGDPICLGSSGIRRGESQRRVNYITGAACVLQWVPSAIELAEARGSYIAWYSGLIEIVRSIQLTAYIAELPEAPFLPWAIAMAEKRVHYVGPLMPPMSPLVPHRR